MKVILNEVVSVILSGGRGERLGDLTKHRTKPAVPFGGIYRIIDFSLSNCINSQLRKIFVLIQYKCLSLSRHLRDGWNFLNPQLGEFIEAIPPQQRVSNMWYMGTADAIFQNIYSLKKENPKYVLVLAGDHVYKCNYRDLIMYHKENNVDVTVGVIKVPISKHKDYGIVSMDDNNKIVKFVEKPQTTENLNIIDNSLYASMGIYVFKAELLYDLLMDDMAKTTSSHDFGKDILPNILDKNNVKGFSFENKEGDPFYWRDVGTIDSYYEANMDLNSVTPKLNLYDSRWPIYTVPTYLPPPKFVFADMKKTNRAGIAMDSLVSPGSIISGGVVKNSILSTNVKINSYSLVENSILMEGVNVGRYSKVRNAIIDKGQTIAPNTTIGYDLEEDKKKYYISPNGVIVLPKASWV